jgi:hypothetical protein
VVWRDKTKPNKQTNKNKKAPNEKLTLQVVELHTLYMAPKANIICVAVN